VKRDRPHKSGPQVHRWLAAPLPADVKQALARLERADDVKRIAVMPDVHLGRGVCVGTVLATGRLAYPQAVGGDIGCGMAAVAFACGADLLSDSTIATAALRGLRETVPILRHRSARVVAWPGGLEPADLSDPALTSVARRDGHIELGTLGRGNHFIEFQADDDGRLWLMVHSGSRAVGQAIADFHIARADRAAGGLCCLDACEPLGQAYLHDAAWAAEYARASRRRLVEAAAGLVKRLGGAATVPGSEIECDHNHARFEEYRGQRLLVHRKGANSAGAGEPAVIPGSMGSRSFHVEGRGCEEALRSSSHGAGRAMSRLDARRAGAPERLERDLEGVWFDRRLASGLVEEGPSAYKDIDAVMRAQRDLVKVVRRLRPVLCFKGV
jgi:tRNA-splicing ligase RtcB